MKYVLSAQSVFAIILLFFTQVLAAEVPSWWKQAADEAKRECYSLITPDALKKLYESKEQFLIVDVRAGYEYDEGHLPRAVSFEFDIGDKLQLKQEKKDAFLELLGPHKNRKIIFYCRSFR